MNCPRCNNSLEVIVEYLQFLKDFAYTRDSYCSVCKSAVVEKFYSDNSYSNEWIDLNV